MQQIPKHASGLTYLIFRYNLIYTLLILIGHVSIDTTLFTYACFFCEIHLFVQDLI